VDDARLFHAELHLARLELLDDLSHVEGHGADLGVGHEPAGPQDLAQLADGAHHVRGGHDAVELEPAALDLLDEIVGAREIGPGVQGFLLLFALGEHEDPHGLAQAVGQRDAAADHLVGVLRVDAETDRRVERLVELGARRADHDLHGLLEGIALPRFDLLLCLRVSLASGHCPKPLAMP